MNYENHVVLSLPPKSDRVGGFMIYEGSRSKTLFIDFVPIASFPSWWLVFKFPIFTMWSTASAH